MHACVCLCGSLLRPIVIAVSPSKPGEGVGEAFGLLVCFTLPLFVCVFVCVLLRACVSLHFLLTIVCVCKNMLSLSLSPLSAPNQCLIGLNPPSLPPTMDKLFLEIPVMKRLFPSLLCLAARPVSLFTLHTHRHICNWRLKCFKDSAVTLLLDKTQNPRTRLKELYKQCSAY